MIMKNYIGDRDRKGITMSQTHNALIEEQKNALFTLFQQTAQLEAGSELPKLDKNQQPSKNKKKYGVLAAGSDFEEKLEKLFTVGLLSNASGNFVGIPKPIQNIASVMASAMLSAIQKSLDATETSPEIYTWLIEETEAQATNVGFDAYFDALKPSSQDKLLNNADYVYAELYNRIQPKQEFIPWDSLDPKSPKSDAKLLKSLKSAPSAPDEIKQASDVRSTSVLKTVLGSVNSSSVDDKKTETVSTQELRKRADIAFAMKKQNKSLDFYKLITDPVYAVEALEKINAKTPAFSQKPAPAFDLDGTLKEMQNQKRQEPTLNPDEFVELEEDTRTPKIGDISQDLELPESTRIEPTLDDISSAPEDDVKAESVALTEETDLAETIELPTEDLSSEEVDFDFGKLQDEIEADVDNTDDADPENLDFDLDKLESKPDAIELIIMNAYPDMKDDVRSSLINSMKQDPKMSFEAYTYLETNADKFEKRILTMFNNVRRDKPIAIEMAKVAQEKIGDVLVATYPDEDSVELNAVVFKSVRTRMGADNTIELAFMEPLKAEDILENVINHNVDKLGFKKTDPNNLPIEDARWLSLVNRVGLVENSPHKEALEKWSAYLPKEEVSEPVLEVAPAQEVDFVLPDEVEQDADLQPETVAEEPQPSEPQAETSDLYPVVYEEPKEEAAPAKKRSPLMKRLLGAAATVAIAAAAFSFFGNNPTQTNDAPQADSEPVATLQAASASVDAGTSFDAPALPAEVTPAAPVTVDYLIQPGDSLSKIAAAVGSDVDTLKSLNGIGAEQDQINAFETLKLPAGANTDDLSINSVSTYDGPTITYTVQSGDTVSSLSTAFNIDMGSFVAMNNIDNPNHIEAGASLQVPDNGDNFTTTVTYDNSSSAAHAGNSAEGGNNAVSLDTEPSSARTIYPTPLMQKNPALRAKAARARIENGQTLGAAFNIVLNSELVQALHRDGKALADEGSRFGNWVAGGVKKAGSWLASQPRPDNKPGPRR